MSDIYTRNAIKEYNSIDILKFILSVFVLVIHSGVSKTIISPLLRLAVPIFFIISGYLFFSKIKRLTEKQDRMKALGHFVKRNVFLYLFWVLLQFPIFIYGKHYHLDFFKEGIWKAFRDIVLGNGFTGSWFIIALVIGTVMIYALSKKISAGWLVLITLPLYILCCLTTNYRGLFDQGSWVIQFSEGYKSIMQAEFNTSFFGGLFWIAIGNFLAKKEISVKKVYLYLLLALSVILIAIERYFILRFDLEYLDDCYVSLVLLCPIIFLTVQRCQFVFQSRFKIREMSTVIYVIHGTCGRIVGFLLKKIPIDFLGNELVKISITFLIAMILGCAFLYVRERYRIKILKYAC